MEHSTVYFFLVQGFYRRSGFSGGFHLDETEAARLPRVFVRGDHRRSNFSELFEEFLKIGFCGVVR